MPYLPALFLTIFLVLFAGCVDEPGCPPSEPDSIDGSYPIRDGKYAGGIVSFQGDEFVIEVPRTDGGMDRFVYRIEN